MRIAIYTLGCKVNQYETQAMESELVRRGHSLVPFEERADAYIINTCAVTAMSGHKSRQIIRRARKENPSATVGVCGCYSQPEPQAVAGLEVDLVSGPAGRMAFLDDLERLVAKKIMSTNRPASTTQAAQGDDPSMSDSRTKEPSPCPLITVGNIMSTHVFEELPAGGLEGRTRAMLKVEDGCVNFCSYCIIPYARGPVRSLSLEKAAAEAGALAEKGYKEIVLTGIEISSWGRDLAGGARQGDSACCPDRTEEPSPCLADLVEAVCAAAPHCRIRLGSLEPRTITEDFCRRISSLHNLCPHFHLSLQSGCDATLKRMNRKYDTARYYESVKLLRKHYVNPGITTDLIVGFPGETGEEFAQTLAFMEKCAFTAMHIFPYSRRPGTPADTMPGQISNAEKDSRAHRAAALAEAMERQYLQSWVGRTLPVLFEEVKGGLTRGYAPNYVEVRVPAADSLHNVERPVRIRSVEGDFLLGELL